MIEENLLLILVGLPFTAAIAASTVRASAHGAAAWVSGLLLAAGLAILAMLHGPIGDGRVLHSTLRRVPSLGLNLTFRMGGFVWMFVTVVFSIGILALVYARHYLSKTHVPAVPYLPHGLHRRHGGDADVGQHPDAGGVPGTDLDQVVPADRLLTPGAGGAGRR